MKLNKTIVITILSIAVFIQLTIISYNHLTGYISITGAGNFFVRLTIGTVFSFIFGLFLVYIDLLAINILDKKFPLPEKIFLRIPSELLAAVTAGLMAGTLVTVTASLIMPYDDGLIKNIINNSLITAVINLIIIIGIEAVIWFKRNYKTSLKTEQLERENSVIRYETLKSQLNPHFLFNSLNVLSSLVKGDSAKAQEFIDQFASVYRYTLDVIDKPVVELSEEIEFARSFIYLQKIRFGEAVCADIKVDASKLRCYVPPLAVQTLLENCFKHNRASVEKPLNISIYNEGNLLFVVNNLQLKIKGIDSKGVGLNNLNKRYELLGEEIPSYIITADQYCAKIRLIEQA